MDKPTKDQRPNLTYESYEQSKEILTSGGFLDLKGSTVMRRGLAIWENGRLHLIDITPEPNHKPKLSFWKKLMRWIW